MNSNVLTNKRSTEDFYTDMIKFKERKERKLEEMRRARNEREMEECK